ncbi:hypothetical protein L2E82_13927 [Cichorium intybus]|uniref:Uncharacterized protein n=1 Tax=Cichorium intybus TaxID=13427 RepID=A0ACB9EY08_CICIN|nr:hypothetical protein L1887_33563 [Cichorium endivia]KAI3763929.1 hypothetical protein L2E82_13927 [Cichorium intybus]
MSIHILSFFNRLIWAIDILINHVFFHHRMLHLQENFDWMSYSGGALPNEEVECAICLSKIEDDDEIRELRCDHLFHRNCLDMWLSYRHATCPLCRDNLEVPPKIDCEISNQEVLFFDFCRTNSNDDEGRWWLR